MASSWTVKRGNKEGGPFTSPQLRSLAKSGQLRKTDLVAREGSSRFVTAEEIKGLTFPASAPDDETPDYGAVEIIDDEEAVILIESDEEDDLVEVIDEYNVVDYDYRAEDGDDEPEPPRSREFRNRMTTVPSAAPRRGRPRRNSSVAVAPKKRSAARKASDEDDDGPWANLFYGIGCLVGGIILFIAMSNTDPNTWETRRKGLVLMVIRLIYNIGGRWTVLGILVLCSGLFFWSAGNQFRQRA